MKTFLISPIKNFDQSSNKEVADSLSKQGFDVHWPYRDTCQKDENGLNICADNLAAIQSSDVVHIVWDGESKGCLFDLGMAFALGKPIIPVSLPPKTKGKSFQNMVTEWAKKST